MQRDWLPFSMTPSDRAPVAPSPPGPTGSQHPMATAPQEAASDVQTELGSRRACLPSGPASAQLTHEGLTAQSKHGLPQPGMSETHTPQMPLGRDGLCVSVALLG